MRQNLTNVSSVDINSVDYFYVVGSTTKEGLIEGKSNVKVDLKKAVAEGGGGDTPSATKFTLDSIRLKSKDDLAIFFDSLEWTSEEGNESRQYVNDPINIKELFVRDDFDFWEFAMKQDILNGISIEIASIPVGDGEDETVTAHFGIIEELVPPEIPALEIDFLRYNKIVSKVFCRMFQNEQGEYEAYLNMSIVFS